MVVGHSEREDLALVHIALHDHLIVLPVMYQKSPLISSDIHSLIKGAPTCLCDNVVLGPCNLVLPFVIFVNQGLLEIIYFDVGPFHVIEYDQELLIPQGKFYVLSLDVFRGERCAD